MRLQSFEIRNYKGIAHAQLDDLGQESVVTISGRNGTGKSLILEALVGLWAQRYSMSPRIGPWSDSLSISMTVELTEFEWGVVDQWHVNINGVPATRGEQSLTFRMRSTAAGDQVDADSPVLGILRNPNFQLEHRFGVIDFLPANRLVPSVPTPAVDLAMLHVSRVEQERTSMLDQFINNRSPMSFPSVANYLVTLDYQKFLAERQGLVVEDEYAMLAASFKAATGKQLNKPEYDAAMGSNVAIELPTGHKHGMSDLSSGEQEMLAMMYFVRRLSAAGGILCIDEPEQHLHPTLQAALFDSMRGLADRAQVLVVSHSVNLIAAAPIHGLVQVAPPEDVETNQVQRLTDHPEKVELIAKLGMAPADLFQSDMLLVVEGDTDSNWLQALFPVELGRAHVIVAGSGHQVTDAYDTLDGFSGGLPWLCLQDRDLSTDEEVSGLAARYPNLHVWPARAIESLFLDADLIVATLAAAGDAVTAGEVDQWLAQAAEPLKEDVLRQLVDRELSRRFPPPSVPKEGNHYDRMEAYLRAYADVNIARADSMAAVVADVRAQLDGLWPGNWRVLVDPKPMMGMLAGWRPVFKGAPALMSALVARARDDASVRPSGLEEFRVRVASMLAGPTT